MSFSLNDTKTCFPPLLFLLSRVLSKSAGICNTFIVGVVLSISHVGSRPNSLYLPLCCLVCQETLPGIQVVMGCGVLGNIQPSRDQDPFSHASIPLVPWFLTPRFWPWLCRLPGSRSHFCQPQLSCAPDLFLNSQISTPFYTPSIWGPSTLF